MKCKMICFARPGKRRVLKGAAVRCLRGSFLLLTMTIGMPIQNPALAQSAFGEMEGRPGPVSLRRCVGGTSAGALCNENADCPGSSCQDRNIFNVSVNVRFPATATQLQTIRDAFVDGNELLFDATDCQAQLGQVTILNNPTGTRGHYWITNPGFFSCSAATGSWGQYSGGNINMTLTALQGGSAAGCVAHEFSHLVFDVRDEYESRAVGCGAIVAAADCPVPESGEETCLMDGNGTEFCWGQGDPSDPTDISGGNHDPANVTEQSRCRSNRSCWDQLGWSFPNTILVPTGAPDPGPCPPPTDIVFLEPPPTARVVLVLDRSGSMVLESPSRMERLKTAALDFVDLAENGMELGLVSFGLGPDGVAVDEVAVAALGADRSAYNNAINGLTPNGWTNIGDGLQHARDMIFAAGGVTSDTYIVLMTDGVNNRPLGTAETDLQSKIDTLLADDIPVYVTCTGDDLGLGSQCAEIASGTNGFYVDSADSADLPEAFTDIHELIRGRQPAVSIGGMIDPSTPRSYKVEIEPGAGVATFVVLWRDPKARLSLLVTDATGRETQCQLIPQGQFCRFENPPPGSWAVIVFSSSDLPTEFVSRAYVSNPVITVAAVAMRPVVQPKEPLILLARPQAVAGPLTGLEIQGSCQAPDGSSVPVSLLDDGPLSVSGDEASEDGTFTAVLQNTDKPGVYTCLLQAVALEAKYVECEPPGCPEELKVDPFMREMRFSATVNDLPPGSIICTESATGEPGTKVSLPITLSDGDGVAGFQVDLHYDAGILTPVGIGLGADTAAAGGWTANSNLIGIGTLRVLGHSNPPTSLGPGFKEVALVDFDIDPDAVTGTTMVSLTHCVLSDELGQRLPCNLCVSAGGVVVRSASGFRFRPIPGPVGVDLFYPLPFPVAVEAIDSLGELAAGYNNVADMGVTDSLCTNTLQPNTLAFTNGLGGPLPFEVACCLQPLLPDTTISLSLEASDAANGFSDMSSPILGVAKGDVDASNSVEVTDVTRTVLLALNQTVPTPPPTAFQKWAADMLERDCVVDNVVNVLDVIRVRNKALGMRPLCPCDRTTPADQPMVVSRSTEPVSIRLVREPHARRSFLLMMDGAQDLGGLQIEILARKGTRVTPVGLIAGQNWQVLTEPHDGNQLRVLAFGNGPAGVSGNGAVLRITGAYYPRLVGALASDSQGLEIRVQMDGGQN